MPITTNKLCFPADHYFKLGHVFLKFSKIYFALTFTQSIQLLVGLFFQVQLFFIVSIKNTLFQKAFYFCSCFKDHQGSEHFLFVFCTYMPGSELLLTLLICIYLGSIPNLKLILLYKIWCGYKLFPTSFPLIIYLLTETRR